jgi:two-component system phosphate regulon sensor histidine kinase PhoR
MFFKPSIIQILISFCTAICVSLLVGLVLQNTVLQIIWVFFITFLCSAILGLLAVKFLLNKELENISNLLDKVKNEDYKVEKRRFLKNGNPLNYIKREIFDFAEKKQQEIDALKKLETFRRELLADVSHELKTPIFSAQGFVHTLIDGAVDDLNVRDRFLGKAANSLDALNILVQDLITISQFEIGEITMQMSNFDLRRLCESVFEQLEDLAANRKVKLRIYRHAPKSCYVYADKNRIRQVLTNLVMNGIKYGREGETLMVNLQIENNFVTVTVKDNGPGIASIHLKRIFERFYRIDKSRSKNLGGTGLGLSIVKHILEAHDSKIRVESTLGKGTSFIFKLKLGRVINEKG